ncbi:MAG: ABC transporter ATP-binding protein [Acidimicrobiales bacterium]|nr:ABC transporter ATP-binding protein [Acidimicrobiales bacterium]
MSLAVHGRVELGRFTLHADLEAEAGEILAVVGPNGSGKTTLLHTIAGLRALSAGFARIGTATVDDPTARTWVPAHRRRVGFVFQDLRLFPHLDVVDNVAYGLRRRGVDRTTARRQAEQWLARVGIAELVRARPRTLSGGQAQRVALARALVTEPDVLLLDEPMSALDADSRLAIRGELRRHLDAYDGIALVIAHDLLDVVGLAARVVVLDEGRVVQDTTPAELRTHPRTRHAAALVGVNLIPAERRGATLTLPGGVRLHLPMEGADGPVDLVCAPRAVSLSPAVGTLPANTWSSTIVGIESVGDHARARLGEPVPIASRVPLDALEDGLVLDAAVTVHIDPGGLHVFPAPHRAPPGP